jgi:hypothetical protein
MFCRLTASPAARRKTSGSLDLTCGMPLPETCGENCRTIRQPALRRHTHRRQSGVPKLRGRGRTRSAGTSKSWNRRNASSDGSDDQGRRREAQQAATFALAYTMLLTLCTKAAQLAAIFPHRCPQCECDRDGFTRVGAFF